MKTDRSINLAVAQMGPVNLADAKKAVVGRMIDMMREAKGRGCEFVVYPELALTTFFPRHWMADIKEADQYFETQMPNDDVAPLFEAAKRYEVGFYFGYAELTPEDNRFNTFGHREQQGRHRRQVQKDPPAGPCRVQKGQGVSTSGKAILWCRRPRVQRL